MVDGISPIGNNNGYDTNVSKHQALIDELSQCLFEAKSQKANDDFNIKGLTLEKSSMQQNITDNKDLQSVLSQSKLNNLRNAEEVKNFIENLENNGFDKVDLLVTDNPTVKPDIYKNLKTGERVTISDASYALEKTITYKKGNMTHTIKMMRDREGNPTGKPYSYEVTLRNPDGSLKIYNYSYDENGKAVLNNIAVTD